MQRVGIKTNSVPARSYILASALLNTENVKPEDWEALTDIFAFGVMLTLGNGVSWELLNSEDNVDPFMEKMLLAIDKQDYESIGQIRKSRSEFFKSRPYNINPESPSFRMSVMDRKLDFDLTNNFQVPAHVLRSLSKPTPQEIKEETWRRPEKITGYLGGGRDLLLEIPDNVRQDWLDACVACLNLAVSEKVHGYKLAESYLPQLKQRFPSLKSPFPAPQSLQVITEELNPHILTGSEYEEKFGGEAPVSNNANEGMIYWPFDPENWGGPWEGNYVAYSLMDSREDTDDEPVKTEAEVLQQNKNYFRTSRYEAPSAALDRIFPGKEWVRREMTSDEVETLRENLHPDLLNLYDLSLEEKFRHFVAHDLNGIPTMEKPWKLFLYGTDDCSYTKVFETHQKALDFLFRLRDTASWDLVHSEMSFTN